MPNVPYYLMGIVFLLSVIQIENVYSQIDFSPIGEWTLFADGLKGNLDMHRIDGSTDFTDSRALRINGTVFGDPIAGYFDSLTGRITFLRVMNSSNIWENQIFTGFSDRFVSPSCEGISDPCNTVILSLVGYFESLGGPDEIEPDVKGWFAHQTQNIFP